MATKIASIAVAGLQVATQWIDHFVVECYADQALTTLVARETSTAIWDGSQYSLQHDLIMFSGLQFGNTYYLRAGVVTPITGDINWSSVFSEVATTAAPPTNTWQLIPGAVLGYTAAGIILPLQPTDVGLDNDHYEASWTYDGSTPADSATPMWKGVADSNNNIYITVPAQSAQQVWVYLRAVNGAQQASSWFLFNAGPLTAGTLDDVADGATYSKVLGTAVESGQVSLMLEGVLQKGSVGPAWYNPGNMTYVATTDSSGHSVVGFYWDGSNGSTVLEIYRNDGTSFSVYPNNIGTAGLAASTSYYFYPYYDEQAGGVQFSHGGSYTAGYSSWGINFGAIAYTQANYPAAQMQGLQTHIPLTPGAITVHTPAASSSGSGGGGAGGIGTYQNCLRHTMLVESRERGIVPLGSCGVGEWIRGRTDWTQITVLQLIWWVNGFIRIGLRDCGFIEATPTHPFTVPSETGEASKQSADLTLSDCLFVRHPVNQLDQIISLEVLKDEDGKFVNDYKARVTCWPEHEFWAGEDKPTILAHNMMMQC